LIATDGSKHSERAAEKAIEIAKLSGGEVVALYVAYLGKYLAPLDDAMIKKLQDSILKEAEDATNYAKKAADLADVPLEKKIVKGYRADEILKAANDADLVIMGSMGRTGISRYLLGSATEKVIRNSKTPVMVVY
jgi:nucleotide-binding universal stress UspA family protein